LILPIIFIKEGACPGKKEEEREKILNNPGKNHSMEVYKVN